MSVSEKIEEKKLDDVLENVVSARGLFSGNFAQLMVFINGVILTIALYLTLTIFIDKIIGEAHNSFANDVKEYVIENFESSKKSIVSAHLILASIKTFPNIDIGQVFSNSYPYKDYFDEIFWMEQDASGRFISRALYSKDLNVDLASEEQAMSNHQKVIKEMLSQKQEDVNVLLDKDAIFIGVKFKNSFDAYDIVYGKTDLKKIVESDYFQKRPTILKLEIKSLENEIPLYSFAQDNLQNIDLNKASLHKLEVLFFDKSLKIEFLIGPSTNEIFLQKILNASLLLGVLFTIIGTLYVHGNRRQSVRLAKMNFELGQNNERLNKEINERERLNIAIRKQEKDNRAIIDSVSDIIFETSMEGKILFLNETWFKVTGFAVERSLGRNIFDLLYAQDQAEQRNNFLLLVNGKKESYRAFTSLRTADGTFRSVELAVSILRQSSNKDIRVVGTITDVEDRKRAETALTETEKKYKAIVENATSGIYQLTPDGQYLSVNPAMVKILGCDSVDDILNGIHDANIEVYLNPGIREKQLQDALRHGQSMSEIQIKKKNGDVIWVNESLRVVKDANGTVIYFEGNIEDISFRKENEIALRNAKVESDLANRAKSEFLANMSHELRTPLNAIIGFSEIIHTQAFGEVGRPEYLEYSKEINVSGKRLLQIINEILDVSRIEAGERQLNEGLIDLSKVVSSTIEMLSSKIESNKITVSNFVDETKPKVIGENHAIKQMVLNLLSNAVKFTPEGGRVTITVETGNDGQLHLSIIDTGIGLTDEEIEIALSPFGQVNSSLNRTEAGTGLGLTLVKSLIELHGGAFELFSQKGIGTTATLTFPAKRVSQHAQKTNL